MSVSAFNRRWAAVILEALTRHGVRHICIAPGSRSTPLTLAAAENSAYIHHTHFDERGLGHLALGLSARIAGGLAGILVAHARLISILWTAVIHPYTFTFPPPGRRHILFHGAACAEKKRRQLEWRWPFVHQYTTVYTLVNSHFVKKGAEKCRAVLWADERT